MESRLVTAIRIVLALVMVAPLIVMTDPLPHAVFPYVVGKALWSRTLIEIAFGLWVVLLLRDSSYRFPRSWTLAVLGVYVLIALLATFFSVSPTRSLWSTYERMQGWVDLAHWATFVVVLVSTHRTWAHWRTLLNFNLGVGILIGALGLTQFFDIKVFEYLQYRNRLDITLGNPTYVGGYMLVNFFIAAAFLAESFLDRSASETRGRAVDRRRRRRAQQSGGLSSIPPEHLWRAFWVAAVALSLTMVFLSGTRSAAVALVAGILAFSIGYALWGGSRRLRVAAIGTTAVMTALASLVVVFILVRAGTDVERIDLPGTMVERLLNTGVRDRSVEGRIAAAEVGMKAFLDRPLLGWGPENYTVGYDRHVGPEAFAMGAVSFDQAHNKLIEELTTKGLLGLLGYLALWVSLAVVYIRKARYLAPAQQAFAFLIGAGLIGYFTQNIFLFDTPGTVIHLYALIGFVVFLDSMILKRSGSGPAQVVVQDEKAADRGPLFPSLRGEMATGSVILVVGVGIAAAVFLLNERPLTAARQAVDAVSGGNAWAQRFEAFEDSVSTFPPLSNTVRMMMFREIGTQWVTLNGNEAAMALEAVETHGPAGTKAEPEEWRLLTTMAVIYQQARSINEEYVGRARQLVEEAVELAPSRVEVRALLIAQHLAEDDLQGALRLIERYTAEAPDAAHHYEPIREQVESEVKRLENEQGSDE